MNFEVILTLLIPISLISFPLVFLLRFNFFHKLDIKEKYIFSLATAICIITSILSIYGYIFKSGYRVLSVALFVIGLISLITLLLKIKKHIPRFYGFIKNIFLEKDWLRGTLFIIFILFLLKLLLFALFKPVIDPDMINSYLPYARSIFLADKIPERSFYDNSIILFPPIGGLVFFTWFYSITANIFTESFRLFPVIVIIGIIISAHKITQQFYDKKITQLATIILLIFPFWDDYFLESLFYPDSIALFLFLTFFYFLIKDKITENLGKENFFFHTIIFLFLGTTILFKAQYFIAYYFIGLLILVNILPKRWFSYLILLSGCTPIIYRYFKGVGYQLLNPILIIIFSSLVYLILILMFKERKVYRKLNFKIILLILLGTIIPGIIYLRNIIIYGNFLSPIRPEYTEVRQIFDSIKIANNTQLGFLEWGIFLFSGFGPFWLIPKFFGFIKAGRALKTKIIVLFILVWFSIITLLFGSPNTRSLMPILPFLSIIITIGFKNIYSAFKVNENNVKKYFIIISILLSLFYSTFLWWNGGLILLGPLNLRRALNNITITVNKPTNISNDISNKNPLTVIFPKKYRVEVNNFIAKATNISIIFTARDYFYSHNIVKITIVTIISSVILIVLSLLLSKFSLNLKIILFLSILLIFLPFLLTFIIISKGNLLNFKKIEQRELYNYWGQDKYIIPFLEKNLKKEDKIIIWSVPTGLAYILNVRTYNILYSYVLGETFKKVYNMTDLNQIYNFYKKNDYKYIIISSSPETYKSFLSFTKITKMFDILNNKKYTSLEIKPGEDNFWYVYKLVL